MQQDLFRGAAVRPDLQDQLVVVCDLSDTRVLNCEVALAFILVFINGLSLT